MTKTANNSNKLVPVLILLLVIAVFVIGMLYTQVRLVKTETDTTAKRSESVAVATSEPDVAGNNAPAPAAVAGPGIVDFTDAQVLGAEDAKVAVVEFTDYECPFCEQLYSDAGKKIRSEYVDTGKVKYIVMDYPLIQLHPQAQKASEASHCAAEQGKYWEYHDILFENQSALQVENLKQYASDLGLNTDQFATCLDNDTYAEKVTNFQTRGQQYGVRGTPASFIGLVDGNTITESVQLPGAYPFESFKAAIDDKLGTVN